MKTIETANYSIKFDDAATGLNDYISENQYSEIFILVDQNTDEHCLKLINNKLNFKYSYIRINSGEENKNINTAQNIWNGMLDANLDRHSLMINIGGGVIGDMGGFCASTYMRGIDFIQVPTTLLAQVDASVGGKLAVDMNAYKNIIGLFNEPKQVIIDTQFLKTLDPRELMSGYAELLKHGLIKDENLYKKLCSLKINENTNWNEWVYTSVQIKHEIVSKDYKETNIRKTLNFGHTIGHAIESELLTTSNKLLHGEAIIIGMICESYLSTINNHISMADCDKIKKNLKNIYPEITTTLPDIKILLKRMKKDKKNKSGIINFSLLSSIGQAIYDQTASVTDIENSLIYYLK